jgi:proteasome lid subunit RPN8/RPN11
MKLAEVLLYKGEERGYYGRLSLEPLLKQALRSELGEAVERVRFVLLFHRVPDDEPIEGQPELVNLLPSHGELDLLALDDRKLVYRHGYSVRDLFGPVLRELVGRIDPAETRWSFRISHPVLDRERHIRPVPQIEGTVDVDLHEPRHLPFSVNKVDEPEIASVKPEELGIDGKLDPINVLLPEHVHRLLLRDLPLSHRIEEGGFLLGTVRRAAGDDQRFLVQITEVTPAQSAGAGAGHFTFTGDSFSAVNRLIGERGRGEELIGWYHTHPFPPSRRMGLSAVDVDLHFATFRRPWQVAGLINVTNDQRVLRFYGRVGSEMRVCAQWICDERDRYSFAGTRLGDR